MGILPFLNWWDDAFINYKLGFKNKILHFKYHHFVSYVLENFYCTFYSEKRKRKELEVNLREIECDRILGKDRDRDKWSDSANGVTE